MAMLNASDAVLIDGYIESLRWANRSLTTQRQRRSYLGKLSRELGPFERIKAPELQLWLGNEERDLSAATKSLYLVTYGEFYKWAKKSKLLKKNPVKKIEKPKFGKGEPHPIPDEDLERAFSIADRKMAAMIGLGAYAGCRAKEISLVCREDIYDDYTMRLHIVHGKGDKSRWVPLTPRLLALLNEFGLPDSGRLWDHPPQYISQIVNDFLHLEVGTVSVCHALRHYFATKMLQETHDIQKVRLLMGHESIATTQVYAKADMSGISESVTRAFEPHADE